MTLMTKRGAVRSAVLALHFMSAWCFPVIIGGLTFRCPHERADQSTHSLIVPLYIGGEVYPSPYAIPAGTQMHYDGSIAEGVSRYRIYVNVKADLRLAARRDGALVPISAEPMSMDDVLHFIRGVRLSASDVKELVSKGDFSPDELHEIERHLDGLEGQAHQLGVPIPSKDKVEP